MYLFGASGHGKVIIDIVRTSVGTEELEVVYDDKPLAPTLMGLPVYMADVAVLNSCDSRWLIGVGNNRIRKQIAERIKGKFITAIHHSAVVSSTSEIGEGTVVMANAVINAEARVGTHCIINSGAVVEHDCCLEDFVHISPNAALAGGVYVGEGTHVGIGASVIQGVRIGKWCAIGAGAVIIKDVPDGATVVGNPGRIIKGGE
jgi:sugar O-acyltransferase (sialic acid O-acetyltransferase NeuD family)